MPSRSPAPTRARSGSGSSRPGSPAAGKGAAGKVSGSRGATSRGATGRGSGSRAVTAKPRGRAAAGPRPLAAVGRAVGAVLRTLGRLLAGLFHLLAAGTGAATRAATGGARDLDPAHRRDGLGLLLAAGALVSAGGAWWHAGGAGDALATALAGLLGKGALLLPVLLALGAWRVLRHRESSGGRGRLAVGWSALSLGALGVLHVIGGDAAGAAVRTDPRHHPDDVEQRQRLRPGHPAVRP